MKAYAIRRLNPFIGVVQVVETEDARALSLDGQYWEIQVRAAQPEHTWRTENRFEPIYRFFRFGTWTRENGLARVPVSPILDMEGMWRACERLLQQLPTQAAAIPLALADCYELWSLSSENKPLALLASTDSSERTAEIKPTPWNAAPLTEHGFRSTVLGMDSQCPSGDGGNPRQDLERLEKLVRDAAGRPARVQWFRRQSNGDGWPLSPDNERENDSHSCYANAEFPALTVREQWEAPSSRQLLADYIHWIAPFLLLLPSLDDVQRDRIERSARKRASLVAALYRLYPKIINSELVTAARVETRLRQAEGV